MRILSVKQPWATLIARGDKRIELRTWRTTYRGPILIVSSLKRASAAASSFRWSDLDGPRGMALAVVELVDVRFAVEEDWQEACCVPDPGEYAWVLDKVRALDPPFPLRGGLGLRHADDTILERFNSGGER